jgi:hypothetical protein
VEKNCFPCFFFYRVFARVSLGSSKSPLKKRGGQKKSRQKATDRRPGRDKTDKPVAKNAIKQKKRASPEKQRKRKTKQKPRAGGLLLNRQKAPTDLWTRMMNYFTEVRVESFNCFVLKPQELSKPASKPQPPRGYALRLKRPGGPIKIRGAGGERATRHRDLLLCCSGCPVFCLR